MNWKLVIAAAVIFGALAIVGSLSSPSPDPVKQLPETNTPAQEAGYKVVDTYVDKGDGPGSEIALEVIAPESDKDVVAAVLMEKYQKHDVILADFKESKGDKPYATAIITNSELGSKWTGAEPGAIQWL